MINHRGRSLVAVDQRSHVVVEESNADNDQQHDQRSEAKTMSIMMVTSERDQSRDHRMVIEGWRSRESGDHRTTAAKRRTSEQRYPRYSEGPRRHRGEARPAKVASFFNL
jgi:hypothetical protein